MDKDFNFDLVNENGVWDAEKIYDANMKLVAKADMELEVEYIIF